MVSFETLAFASGLKPCEEIIEATFDQQKSKTGPIPGFVTSRHLFYQFRKKFDTACIESHMQRLTLCQKGEPQHVISQPSSVGGCGIGLHPKPSWQQTFPSQYIVVHPVISGTSRK